MFYKIIMIINNGRVSVTTGNGFWPRHKTGISYYYYIIRHIVYIIILSDKRKEASEVIVALLGI